MLHIITNYAFPRLCGYPHNLGNEEAKLHHMAGTRRVEGSIYAGPLYILGDNGQGEFIDLTQEQVDKYLDRFADPEYISDEEVEADCGYSIITFE